MQRTIETKYRHQNAHFPCFNAIKYRNTSKSDKNSERMYGRKSADIIMWNRLTVRNKIVKSAIRVLAISRSRKNVTAMEKRPKKI